MNNKKFILKVLTGKFKKLNIGIDTVLDLSSIIEYFEGCDIYIDKHKTGYRVDVLFNDFHCHFIELENY